MTLTQRTCSSSFTYVWTYDVFLSFRGSNMSICLLEGLLKKSLKRIWVEKLFVKNPERNLATAVVCGGMRTFFMFYKKTRVPIKLKS
ncbi:hypothetical protein L6164_006276 [Bauhinia variegata]|uniref:Uncharacterized protein n=1 Tax=Bauhinia variegata TaxID=167791 RepID=A0ACB9PTY9_BAUVA|nr:hypothetical protein L6164_006276 [Bauhinia variegata]